MWVPFQCALQHFIGAALIASGEHDLRKGDACAEMARFKFDRPGEVLDRAWLVIEAQANRSPDGIGLSEAGAETGRCIEERGGETKFARIRGSDGALVQKIDGVAL